MLEALEGVYNTMKLISLISMIALTSLFVLNPLTFTNEAFANGAILKEVLETAKKFSISMKQCPEKIWANYSWNNFNVYLVYSEQMKVYKWDGQTEEVTSVDPTGLDSRILNGLYNFFELDGKKSMSIRMDQDFAEPFALAVHEGFHYLEDNWVAPQGSRGTDYPLDYKPRYIRKMLFTKLVEYFKGNKGDDKGNDKGNDKGDDIVSLKEAKYWYNQWEATAPKELISTTDGYEGTSQYVQTMANAVAKLGCDASPDQLKSFVLAEVEETYESSYLRLENPSLEFEGYAIGGLASLILAFSQNNNDWQDAFKQEISPLTTLLANVSPQQADDSQEELKAYQNAVSVMNTNMGKFIDEDIQNFNNPDYIRIQLPFNLLKQSMFSPKFFANIKAVPGLTLFPLIRGGLNLISPDQSSYLLLGENSVVASYDTDTDNYCNDKRIYVVLVHKDKLSQIADASGKNIESGVTSDRINGYFFKAKEHVNAHGIKFLCWGQNL